MTAELESRSPLAHRASDLAGATAVSSGRVILEELPFLAQVDLRVSAEEAVLRELIVPHEPNTTLRYGDRAALWLGPDEWLVVGPAGTATAIVAELESALIGADRSVVDVGSNRAWLELGGAGARELLSKGCSLDLHPRQWRTGMCAQTMLARAQVILEQMQDETTRIGVRPSFGDYLVDWLLENTSR